MNKLKRDFIKDWASVYVILILATYVSGVLYWNRHENLYKQGKVAIESDGPMGAMLFIVIPFVMTILFVLIALTYYHLQKRKFNKTGKNQSEL